MILPADANTAVAPAPSAGGAAGSTHADGAGEARPARVAGVLETVLYGRDLDALERFYVEVLGLSRVARVAGRNAVLACGSSAVILFDPEASRRPGRVFPPHGTVGAGHVAFVVPDSEMPGWRARLEQAGVEVEREVTWGDGACSLYVRDPAGNSVELAPPTLWGGLGARILARG